MLAYAKRTGEALSPCCNPVLYLMLMVSLSVLQLMEQFLYIFSTTWTRELGIPYLLRMLNRSGCCTLSNTLTMKRVYVAISCCLLRRRAFFRVC